LSVHEPIDPETAAVPVSSGMPIAVRIAILCGVLLVVFIMCLTAGSSFVGHFWPWTTSMQAPL
jgi:hypothetical protein